MTNLEKSPVTRRTKLTLKGKRMVVSLRADDKIEMRLERSHDTVVASLDDVYRFCERTDTTVRIPPRKK